MSKPNLPELPSLVSEVVDEACWKFIENLPHTIPGPILNDLKPAIYAALCHALPGYAEEAVRQALAEVAKAISTQADAQRVNYEQSGRNSYYEGMADGLDVAEQKVLAIIPEPRDG
ncbi:hypothetical protein [Achromobacter insolitus]|uniref:hypothetical protein n=1 Tax=Achromobacter insolitus TaxID=217204 RepID=UPI0007C3362C|nr:hypothetical protein [Achromobacter insolitus]OAD17153.1 hypothetical protein A3839_24445 [Achromobacter insolitus]